MKQKAVFLNRSYNDIDIQMPLVEQFALDPDFDVRVVGYECDGNTGNPAAHEAAAYMRANYGVSFETMSGQPRAPFWLGLFCRLPLRLQKRLGFLQKWQLRAAREWKADIIIADEVAAYKGRSYFMDVVLPRLIEDGAALYLIQTGHLVYPDTSSLYESFQIPYRPTGARMLITSNRLGADDLRARFTEENYKVFGNLRMDRGWVKRLHEEILVRPHFDRDEHLSKLPKGKVKVVMMLSKIQYGLELEQLTAAIRSIGHMKDVALAIKPHTRGMKFNFMDEDETGNAVIADSCPSPVLIEWADILLFTGSSIAFHAMLLDRDVGLLDYCKSLETIFDDGKACAVINSLGELEDYVRSRPERSGVRNRAADDEWIDGEVYAGLSGKNTAGHYKDMILQDYRSR